MPSGLLLMWMSFIVVFVVYFLFSKRLHFIPSCCLGIKQQEKRNYLEGSQNLYYFCIVDIEKCILFTNKTMDWINKENNVSFRSQPAVYIS